MDSRVPHQEAGKAERKQNWVFPQDAIFVLNWYLDTDDQQDEVKQTELESWQFKGDTGGVKCAIDQLGKCSSINEGSLPCGQFRRCFPFW